MNGNKKETLFEALLGVKREFVEEAERFSFKKPRTSLTRILGAAAAACLVIALAVIAVIPKTERQQHALNPGAKTTGEPNGTLAPIRTDAPHTGQDKIYNCIPEHAALEFKGMNDLRDFFASIELSDEEFERFIMENDYTSGNIHSKEDVRAACELMNGIPFPISKEHAIGDVTFFNDSESEYFFRVNYQLDENRSLSFLSSAEEEYGSAVMLNRIVMDMDAPPAAVDIGEHEHIEMLYCDKDVHVNVMAGLYALIDGRCFKIDSFGSTRDEAIKAILSFDFTRLSDALADYTQANDLLVFTSEAQLVEFIDSVNLSDEEFSSFIRAGGYERFGIVTKDDLRAVITLMDKIPFPICGELDLCSFSIRLDGETDHYCVQYWLDESGIGRVCAFSGYLKGMLSSADMIEKIENRGESVEFGEHDYIRSLNFRFEGKHANFIADIDGRFVNIAIETSSLDEALKVILAFDFTWLTEEFAHNSENSFGIELFSHEELARFVAAANAGNDVFDAWLCENSEHISGIMSAAQAQRAIGLLDFLPFPVYTKGSYSRLYLSGGYDGDYSLHYEFGNKVWIFSNYFRDENGDGVRDTLDDFVRSYNLRKIEVEHEHINRLYALDAPFGHDSNNIFYAEVDGKLMELNAYNQTEAEAVQRILEFDFVTLAELDASAAPSTPAEPLWYYHIELKSPAELTAFVNSSNLSDAEFAIYLKNNAASFKREGMLTVRSKADVEAVVSLFESFPFPHYASGGFDKMYIYVRDREYFEVTYDFPGYTVWSFAPYCDDNGVNRDKTLDEVIAEKNLKEVSIPHGEQLSRLCVKRSDSDYIRMFYAQINDRLVMIDAHNQSETEAVQRITEFDYCKLSDLLER